MERDYFEFIVRDWVPATHRVGLQTIAAWYTVYSHGEDTPQIMVEALADDFSTMRSILETEEWRDLFDKLMEYVENYEQKIVPATGDFQL